MKKLKLVGILAAVVLIIKAHYKSYQRVLVRVDLVKLKSGKSQFDS